MKKIINKEQLDDLRDQAVKSKRKRGHLNIHTELDANVQRLFIATEPDTYMRPHRHPQSHKWEFFVVLNGRIDLMIFSNTGDLLQRVIMTPECVRAIEIPHDTWHCYVCMKSGTLALEVKEGAYIPTDENDFAPWAPEEYSAQANDYLAMLRTATVD